MAEEANDSSIVNALVANAGDPHLYELLFNLVQEAQAAGCVVQIVTIWPATGPTDKESVVHPTKCRPSGACPK